MSREDAAPGDRDDPPAEVAEDNPQAGSTIGETQPIADGGEVMVTELNGRVRGIRSGGPVEDATITIKTTANDIQLGQATTDSQGRFVMPEFGRRVREEASADRPEVEIDAKRSGQSVRVRFKSFDWNAFASGDYLLDLAIGPPTGEEEEEDEGSDGSTSGSTDAAGTPSGNVMDVLENMGPLYIGEEFTPPAGVIDPESFGPGVPDLPKPCDCENCESAVSPAAYLAHLLRYASEHVEHRSSGSWQKITTQTLEESFHQPFGRLPTSCDEVTDTVRHVRVGTEVLLDYLDTELPSNYRDIFGPPSQGLVPQKVIEQYEQTAYETLLEEWGGVSLRELRRADYDESKRESVAERIGIAPEHVNGMNKLDLFLDPDANPIVSGSSGPQINDEAVTQVNLEELFGLPALTEFDPQNGVRVVQDPLDPVPEPAIEKWRQSHMRERWQEQDHPPDAFPKFVPASGSSGVTVLRSHEEERPAIDPDLIGPDDIREPTGSGAAITVWETRRKWVDDQLETLWEMRPNLSGMVGELFNSFKYPKGGQSVSTAWSRTQITVPLADGGSGPTIQLEPNLDSVATLASHFEAEETDAETLTERVKSATRFNAEEFIRLGTLSKEHTTRNASLDSAEFWEVVSLIVTARKRSLHQEWIEEERNQGSWTRSGDRVQLGPEQFWHSQREPDQGPWSSRLDAHDSAGITQVRTGTFTTPENPQTQTIEVGFEPDVVVFTATVPGDADEMRDGRSGDHGVAHGAAHLQSGGSINQHTLRAGEATDGSAVGASYDDAAFAVPVTVNGTDLTITGDVTGQATGGFDIDIKAPNLGSGTLPGVVVGYRAYETAESADVEVGNFRTKGSTGNQTVQFGVNPDSVSLTATSLVDQANASGTHGTVGISQGVVAGDTNPSQTVVATTLGGDDGSYAAADDTAIDILFQDGGSVAGRTTAMATSLDGDLELDFTSVYTGQENPGDVRKLVGYVAVDAGDDLPGQETRPTVGHFETPADSGVIEVETGFEPAMVEFTVCPGVGSLGDGSTSAVGWTEGTATAEGQHALALASGAPDDAHASLVSTTDAVSVLYADDRGQVSGRETGHATLEDSGFRVEFPVTATAAESAATSDQVVVFYRAWPSGVAAEPYVDPERVDRSDLPEVTAGVPARRLYEHRKAQLKGQIEAFEQAYESASGDNPMDAVLDKAYGTSLFAEPWTAVLDRLAEAMEVEDRDAGPRLSVLQLSPEEFETLRAVHRRAGGTDSDQPSDQELGRVFEILVTAWKLRKRYPPGTSDSWVAEEQSGAWIGDADSSVQPSNYSDYAITEYWEARKAALPAWRGDQSSRREWQRSLDDRAGSPVVDPDVIGNDHIAAGNATATALLNNREGSVTLGGGATHQDLAGLPGLNAGSFHTELKSIVGIGGADLERIQTRIGRGEDVSPRLRQLDLSYESLEYLTRVHEKVTQGHQVSDEEWANVRQILVEVWKHRAYGRWRREELADDIFIDPDGFAIPEDENSGGQRDEDGPLVRWRRHLGLLRDWGDTLETRVNALEDLDQQIGNAIAAAEEAAMPPLRDELVMVVANHLHGEITTDSSVDVPEPMLNDAHQLVSERLLIDVETDACRETTRVSQATTAIQQLIKRLHRRYSDDPGPVDQSFRLEADRFDQVWEWLGTYPKWKAAVGVYIYPENAVLPTMRERRTPGFRELEGKVQTDGIGQLTADLASEAAERYTQYMEDVLTLSPGAGCLVEVDAPKAGETILGYAFAQGDASETVYYRAFDPTTDRESPPGNRDGLWKPVPTLSEVEVIDIVGACTYEGSVFLIVEVSGDENSKLGYVAFDTDGESGSWREYSEVSLETDSEDSSSSEGDSSNGESSGKSDGEGDDEASGRKRPIVSAEVVTVKGEAVPPELFVQLGGSEEDHWKEFTVLHGRFTEDGEAPESFVKVELGLRDLHYSTTGRLNRKPRLAPPYEVAGVVRRKEMIRTGPSTTFPVWVYNVFVEGLADYRVYCYHPGANLQPKETPAEEPLGVLQDSHHNKHKFLEQLWNREVGGWKFEKDNLSEKKDEKGLSEHERKQLRKYSDLLIGDPDFNDEADILDIARRLEQQPRGYRSFNSNAPHWVNYDSYGVTPDILRDHVVRGDWSSTHVEGDLDYVIADFEANETYGVDRTASETSVHDLKVVNDDWRWYYDTVDGPYNLYGGSTLLQCNNARPGANKEFLKRPALVSIEHGQNTYFGFTSFIREDPSHALGFHLGFNPRNADIRNFLGPVVPDESGLSGEWLYGVTMPLESADEGPEKDRQFDRTKTMLEANYSPLELRSESIRPYVEEAYFQVPLLIARQLAKNGEFEAALDWFGTIYDHTRPKGERKLWYGLRRTPTARETRFDPKTPWMANPLRPHEVARTRTDHVNPYTLFTQLSLVQCLAEFGDEEFSRDTSSSVARATTLYEEALDVLDAPELAVYADPCERASLTVGDGLGLRSADEVERARMAMSAEVSGSSASRRDLLRALDGLDFRERYRATTALNEGDTVSGSGGLLEAIGAFTTAAGTDEDGNGDDDTPSETDANDAGDDGDTSEGANGPAAGSMELGPLLEATETPVATALETNGQRRAAMEGLLRDGSVARAVTTVGETMQPLSGSVDEGAAVQLPFDFCVPTNPWPKQLRQHVEGNLEKIRSCRNIAGLRRELEPYAASTGVEGAVPTPGAGGGIATGTTSTVQPTDYRYSTLVKRAKELVRSARQIETEYLSAIEKMEQEEYKLRKARQDVELADQRIELQELRVDKAQENVELARLQRERSRIKVQHYRDLLATGRIQEENKAIQNLQQAINLKKWAFGFQMGAVGMHLAASVAAGVDPRGSASSVFSSLAAASSTTASGFSTQASIRQTRSQILQMKAKYRRRAERWRFQRELAQQSVRIGNQKVDIARDELGIARQRREISELKADQARDMVNYLSEEQFTDRELYQWMSGVLGRVYRYFLQEAAATAKLAERQLAFQRQESPPGVIQSGYWEAPTSGGTAPSDDSEGPDRRGLTGSVRLLQDIEQLDQYAMETDERELKVEKTIALSELDPIALQQFRESGVVSFATPMELFDREAPGRYLRLIDDVSVSIVALTDPTHGINATLQTTGNSWVVVGDTIYRKKPIRRQPQSIALDRARGEERDGEMRLTPSDRERLRPFEYSGVETEWKLRMPKAANQFDYDTIADVLLTIEYTARESHDYRQQVQDRLDPERVFDRTFSVKDDLGDEWYELNNPGTTDSPMTISFETDRNDFPPNISRLEIDDIALLFAGADGETLERLTVDLRYSPAETNSAVGGQAAPVEGMVVTPSASAWNAILGKDPVGEWTLSLPDSGYVRRLFEDDEIEDLLIVVSVEGEVPDWPT